MRNINGENGIDQQLRDILHPSRFRQNFGMLTSFESYIKGYVASYSLRTLLSTLKAVLKDYEDWEGYEQCFIIKNIIDEIKTAK